VFGTSGGFDVLNSAFFVLIMAIAYYFIKHPSSRGFCFLIASLLVFSNIRYESITFLVILPVLCIRRIKWQYIKDGAYLWFLTPLVNLPYLWQRILKTDAYQNPEGTPVFSANLLLGNLVKFFKNLIDVKYFLPYAGILSIISMLIFVYLFFVILKRRKQLQGHQFYSVFVISASVLASTLIYFTHFFGDYIHPSSARLFITLSIAFALAPIALKIFKPNFMSSRALLVISVIFFLFYHPIAVEGRFINALMGNRRTEHCIDFVTKIGDKNILIITERPGQFTALGYGAINFAYANKYKENTMREVKRHLSSRIFVFQDIMYDGYKPTETTALHPDFKLKTLYEVQNSATEFLRISEIQVPPEVASKAK
jgi:hypothetical protein